MIMRRFDKKDMGEIYKNKHFCWSYSQYTNMCSLFMCVLYHTKCVYASKVGVFVFKYILGTAFWAFGIFFAGGAIYVIVTIISCAIDYISNEKWRIKDKISENTTAVLCFCIAIAAGAVVCENDITAPEIEDNAYSSGYEDGYTEGLRDGEEKGIEQVLDDPTRFELFSME